VSQGLDVTPPIVVRGEPVVDFVAFAAQTADIKVFTNEPSTCKISTTDMLYDNMQNEMICSSDATEQGLFGYGCTTQQALQGNTTTFYVRCADQPWLNETDIANGKKRNVNGQSLIISLKKSLTQLKIDYLEPNNKTISSNVYPATVELLAGTSGGVNGNAICALNISGNLVNFLNTGFRTHSWSLNQMTPGNKTAQVICTDDAGNTATKTSTFSVVIDDQIPIITRVYGKQNSLYVVTDEPSFCSYSTKQCDFEFETGNVFSGIDKVHTTYLDKNKDYFIACKDRLGNKAGQCTIVVRKGATLNA
jgi:CheY-specific phosphatase CheX